MESQPQAGRIPLPELVVRSENAPETSLVVTRRISATGGADGAWAFVYTPRGMSFSVDLPLLRAQQLDAEWYDPRMGHLRSIGTLDTGRRRAFDPPGKPAAANDWVLVLR